MCGEGVCTRAVVYMCVHGCVSTCSWVSVCAHARLHMETAARQGAEGTGTRCLVPGWCVCLRLRFGSEPALARPGSWGLVVCCDNFFNSMIPVQPTCSCGL